MSAEPPRDGRDRDALGRPRNARPRDALGRPLGYGAEGAVPVADSAPQSSPAGSLRRAQLLLDDGKPFQAHEVLEDAWKAAPAGERELWRGLAQLAVGLTHAARGNRTGAAALISRGAATLAGAQPVRPHGVDVAGSQPVRAHGGDVAGSQPVPPHGVDVAGLQAWAAAAVAAITAAGPAAGAEQAELGPPRLTRS